MLDGVVHKAMSGFYYVKAAGEQEMVRCSARGRFRLEKNSPLVGDIVRITITEVGKGILTEILPRKNSFIRPPLANIDKMIIVASAAIPVSDPFLIDKMTVIALNNNCIPIICINKLDINSADELYEIYKNINIFVVRTSAATCEGINDLIKEISGTVCAFCGNSGVGKSSILNTIDPDFRITVGEVSQKLGRGRHTTRHVELYELSCGALVADTPGFSAFDTGIIAAKDDLQNLFPDFEPYINKCRYDDCAHINEPDCAVTTALIEGKLQKTRHESYKRLYEHASKFKAWELN